MSENKSSVSKQTTYSGIGEYWDSHELDDSFFEGDDVAVEIDIKSRTYYLPIDESLLKEVSSIAKNEGVDQQMLVNRWISEKVAEKRAA